MDLNYPFKRYLNYLNLISHVNLKKVIYTLRNSDQAVSAYIKTYFLFRVTELGWIFCVEYERLTLCITLFNAFCVSPFRIALFVYGSN